jgi:hypothetical protein
MDWMNGVVVPGYGAASGRSYDSRYPGGTIRAQKPYFMARGIDLSQYFDGTLNVDLAPHVPRPRNVLFQGRIRWHPDIEELFMLSPVEVEAGGKRYAGLSYYPHPETKKEHFQPESVIELLLPWIDGLTAGSAIKMRFV